MNYAHAFTEKGNKQEIFIEEDISNENSTVGKIEKTKKVLQKLIGKDNFTQVYKRINVQSRFFYALNKQFFFRYDFFVY